MHRDRTIWPEIFPADCPPSDAYREDQSYFRFIKTDVCLCYDFFSYRELYPEKEYSGERRINSYGLSVYDNIEEAQTILIFPKANRKFNSIATGSVYNGLIKYTGAPGHITWWVFKDEKPEEYFSIIFKIEDYSA